MPHAVASIHVPARQDLMRPTSELASLAWSTYESQGSQHSEKTPRTPLHHVYLITTVLPCG